MKYFLFVILLTTGFSNFAKDNVQDLESHEGKQIFTENCLGSCHKHATDDLFTRKNSMVKSRKGLSRVVSFCVSTLGLEIFPEDEVEVADYLHKKYYKLD